MMLFFTFILGLFINAIGYIPPGNITLTLAQINVNKGMRQAWSFIIAFSFVEMFFTFGMMHFVRWTSSDISMDTIIGGWFSIGTLVNIFMVSLLLVMGTIAWINRNKTYNVDSKSRMGSMAYGALLAAFNPMQIPYLLFFGNFIVIKNWMDTDYPSLVSFSIGSAFGVALVLYGYAHFARYIQEKFALSSSLINKSIAVFLFILAFVLIIKQMMH